jgi:hypothetical protein
LAGGCSGRNYRSIAVKWWLQTNLSNISSIPSYSWNFIYESHRIMPSSYQIVLRCRPLTEVLNALLQWPHTFSLIFIPHPPPFDKDTNHEIFNAIRGCAPVILTATRTTLPETFLSITQQVHHIYLSQDFKKHSSSSRFSFLRNVFASNSPSHSKDKLPSPFHP